MFYSNCCFLTLIPVSQEAAVRTGHETTDWFQAGKGVRQGFILSPWLFNFYVEYIMRNAGLDKHKLESRFLGEMSITSDMQITPPLWQKVKRNWRASWWKWKESEKAGLKLNIQKMKIMVSGPITSWEIDGETAETVSDFIFWGFKITADGDRSHEIKRTLTPWKKSYDQPR